MERRLLGLVWGLQRNGNAFDLLGRVGESPKISSQNNDRLIDPSFPQRKVSTND